MLFDLELQEKKTEANFYAHLDAAMIGQTMLANTRSTGAIYKRSRKALSADGIDSIMVQLYLSGATDFDSPQIYSEVLQGDIIVYDLAKPVANNNTNFNNLSILFPRELIESYLPTVSRWHGQVLPRNRPLTKLLKQHMISLHKLGGELTIETSVCTQRTLLDLASSALQHSADILPKHAETLPTALLIEIKQFIRKNLHKFDLYPSTIASAFHLSRAQLYRVTEPLGGLSSHIREQRMRHALQLIQSAQHHHLSIAEIGYQCGFSCPNSFSRNFKKFYNFSPRDARSAPHLALKAANESGINGPDRSYESWVKSLSL